MIANHRTPVLLGNLLFGIRIEKGKKQTSQRMTRKGQNLSQSVHKDGLREDLEKNWKRIEKEV